MSTADRTYFTLTVQHRQVSRLRINGRAVGKPIASTRVGGNFPTMDRALQEAAERGAVIARNVNGDMVITKWAQPAGCTPSPIERILL
jgi:hypothetical protein